jgi:hypothetical protein
MVLGSGYAGRTWVALPCPAQREVQAMFDISVSGDGRRALIDGWAGKQYNS